ncbi:peptidase M28 [Actinomadura fibrosa]|uniref:Peptidase M28 n=1 Tax=Actinomadura fibrosa TaxID=111802 RepID=A0ABW2XSM5_9ACTN
MSFERFLHPVSPAGRPDEEALSAAVRPLAAIERPPCSPGEREAAHLIADRLLGLGAAARVEEVPARGPRARPAGALAGLAALAGLLGGLLGPWPRAARVLGALGGTAAALGTAAELSGGARSAPTVPVPVPVRVRRRTACNVVAGLGDASAPRTLVVVAHHGAVPRPGSLAVPERFRHVPVWWTAVAGPVLVAFGAVAGRRAVRVTGTALSAAVAVAAGAAALVRRPVPGSDDGLTGVPVLVALAESVHRRPLHGLRIVLLSAGGDPAWQDGAAGFALSHFPSLARTTTWFLVLDGVGSGELVLLGAEGRLRGRAYDPAFGELIARCAVEQGLALRRVPRSFGGSAGSVPLRAGYTAACLTSTARQGAGPRDGADYRCVADATQLTEAVARALAAATH